MQLRDQPERDRLPVAPTSRRRRLDRVAERVSEVQRGARAGRPCSSRATTRAFTAIARRTISGSAACDSRAAGPSMSVRSAGSPIHAAFATRRAPRESRGDSVARKRGSQPTRRGWQNTPTRFLPSKVLPWSCQRDRRVHLREERRAGGTRAVRASARPRRNRRGPAAPPPSASDRVAAPDTPATRRRHVDFDDRERLRRLSFGSSIARTRTGNERTARRPTPRAEAPPRRPRGAPRGRPVVRGGRHGALRRASCPRGRRSARSPSSRARRRDDSRRWGRFGRKAGATSGPRRRGSAPRRGEGQRPRDPSAPTTGVSAVWPEGASRLSGKGMRCRPGRSRATSISMSKTISCPPRSRRSSTPRRGSADATRAQSSLPLEMKWRPNVVMRSPGRMPLRCAVRSA